MRNLKIQTRNQVEEVNQCHPRHLHRKNLKEIKVGKVDHWNVRKIVKETRIKEVSEMKRRMIDKKEVEIDVINRQTQKMIKQTIESIMRDVTEVGQKIDTENVIHPQTRIQIIITVPRKSQIKSIQRVVKNLQTITHQRMNENIKENTKEANIIEIAHKFKFYFRH